MLAILNSLGMSIVALFKPRCRLEAENLFLRHPAWPLTIEHETAGSYEVLWPSPFGRLAWNLPSTTT